MTLDEILSALRAAGSGSASLDNAIADYLQAPRGTQYTRRLQDLLSLAPNKEFIGDISLTIEGGEICTTFGTPPDFADHSHGKHPSSALLAACACVLKYRERRA